MPLFAETQADTSSDTTDTPTCPRAPSNKNCSVQTLSSPPMADAYMAYQKCISGNHGELYKCNKLKEALLALKN